jgi:MOSC domain-containing protein YiiM
VRVRSLQTKPLVPGERGIPKLAVAEIFVTTDGVGGDYNRYRSEKKNGDPDHAVLLMPYEMLQTLNAEGWPVAPGDLGENLTTEGIDYAAMQPGTRVALGEVVLEITEACVPCSNLQVLPYIGRERVKEFIQTLMGRRGWYAKVIAGGTIRAEQTISL